MNALSIVTRHPRASAREAAAMLHQQGFSATVMENVDPAVGNKLVLLISDAFEGWGLVFRRHLLRMGRPAMRTLNLEKGSPGAHSELKHSARNKSIPISEESGRTERDDVPARRTSSSRHRAAIVRIVPWNAVRNPSICCPVRAPMLATRKIFSSSAPWPG